MFFYKTKSYVVFELQQVWCNSLWRMLRGVFGIFVFQNEKKKSKVKVPAVSCTEQGLFFQVLFGAVSTQYRIWLLNSLAIERE